MYDGLISYLRHQAKRTRLLGIGLLLGCIGASNAAPLAKGEFEHVRISVFSEHDVLQPAGNTRIAIQFEHETHWHTYWQFPGDSGLPTKHVLRVNGQTLESVLRWPVPKPLVVGGIHNIGYEGTSVLLSEFAVPNDAGNTAQVELDLSWLICKEECIPGRAQFQFELPVAQLAQLSANNASVFLAAQSKLPMPAPDNVRAEFFIKAERVWFRLQAPAELLAERFPDISASQLFVADNTLAAVAQSPLLAAAGSLSTVRDLHESFVAAPAALELLWASPSKTGQLQAISVLATPASADFSAGIGSPADLANSSAATAPPTQSTTFFWALLLAFGGGVILNLMPCVFPVLSLKVLGFLEVSPAAVRVQSLAYSGGVIISFLSIGLLWLSVRGAGAQLGWGFQLQSSGLIATLALLMFVLGLSMSGLVHFGYRLQSLSQQASASDSGWRGAFFNGVLACVIASPCTAPMMGTALGYALVQPALICLSVLLALGLGFAAPMLLLAIKPAYAARMPKPGAWMQTLKQALAVPMYLSAIWLLWIFGQQRDIDSVALLLVAATLLAIGLIWREQLRFGDGRLARLAALGLAALALIPLYGAIRVAPPADVQWQAYSASTLQQARAQQQPVLVQMTAAWCVTCKVNERVAMSGPTFAALLKKHEVVAIKGDWTREDAAITSYLRTYGASGVPLVVLYSKRGTPEVLPQVLTPSLVAAAVRRAAEN